MLAFFIYDDSLNVVKGFGLAAALLSFVLVTTPDGQSNADRSLSIKLLPLSVFASFGCYFTIIKYAQAHYLNESTYHAYVMAGFLFAFLTSVIIGTGENCCGRPAIFGGHATGGNTSRRGVNYIAVYALIKMLALRGWQSSQLYPIYSVGSLV